MLVFNCKVLVFSQQPSCNCRNKQECPLNGKCRRKNIVYLARINIQNPNENQNQNEQTPTHTDENQLDTPRNPRRERGTEAMDSNNDNNVIDRNIDNTEIQHPIHTKEMFYIGAAEDFKTRFGNHQKSFKHRTSFNGVNFVYKLVIRN